MKYEHRPKFVGAILVATTIDAVTRRTLTLTVVVNQINRKRQFPGGTPEKGETLAQTASREVFQETGIYIEPWRFRLLRTEEEEPEARYLTTLVPFSKLQECISFRGNDGEIPEIHELAPLRTSGLLDDRHCIAYDQMEADLQRLLYKK